MTHFEESFQCNKMFSLSAITLKIILAGIQKYISDSCYISGANCDVALANAEDFTVKHSLTKIWCIHFLCREFLQDLLYSEEKYFHQILSDCFEKRTFITFALRNPANVLITISQTIFWNLLLAERQETRHTKDGNIDQHGTCQIKWISDKATLCRSLVIMKSLCIDISLLNTNSFKKIQDLELMLFQDFFYS